MVRWLIASRAPVLIMTFCSAAVGGMLALLNGPIDPVAWVACLIGLLLAHATNNQLNDFTDSALGIDKDNYFRNRYGAHVLEDGLMTRRQLLVSIAITGVAALLIGVWLTQQIGGAVLWPLAGGALLLLFYTYPLKKLGLGELAVLLVWGPFMTGGSYLAASGTWSAWAASIGAVYALAPTAVIFGKHIDKYAFDREKGVRTLPVRLGAARARQVAIAMLVLPYIAIPATGDPRAAALTELAGDDRATRRNTRDQGLPTRSARCVPTGLSDGSVAAVVLRIRVRARAQLRDLPARRFDRRLVAPLVAR